MDIEVQQETNLKRLRVTRLISLELALSNIHRSSNVLAHLPHIERRRKLVLSDPLPLSSTPVTEMGSLALLPPFCFDACGARSLSLALPRLAARRMLNKPSLRVGDGDVVDRSDLPIDGVHPFHRLITFRTWPSAVRSLGGHLPRRQRRRCWHHGGGVEAR